MSVLFQLLANGLVTGSVCAVVALGFALVYNSTRIFHLAHGAVFAAAGFSCYYLVRQLGWNPWVAIPLAIALAGLIGMAIEVLVYRPLWKSGRSLLAALLSSLGVYVIVVNTLALLFGSQTRLVSDEVGKIYSIQGFSLTSIQVLELVSAATIIPAVLIAVRATRFGTQMRALRDNPALCGALGIDVTRMRLLILIIGSALVGIPAFLYTLDLGVDPNEGMPIFLAAAVAAIMGGLGTFGGPVLGAFAFGFIQSLVVWKASAQWADAVTFALLLIFLVFRPEGIFGKKIRVEESNC